MNQTTTTYIKEMSELKHGVREDDSTWTLWLVTDADNDRCTSFEPMLLGKALENRTEVVLTFTEEDSGKFSNAGKPLMNRSIVSVKLSGPSQELSKLIKDIEKLKTAVVDAGIVGPDYFA